jgi:hypothetical protein
VLQLLVKWWSDYPAELLEQRVVAPMQAYLTKELMATKKLTIGVMNAIKVRVAAGCGDACACVACGHLCLSTTCECLRAVGQSSCARRCGMSLTGCYLVLRAAAVAVHLAGAG